MKKTGGRKSRWTVPLKKYKLNLKNLLFHRWTNYDEEVLCLLIINRTFQRKGLKIFIPI